MNLAELQQELRKIEMKLASLNNEIESMKPKKENESEEEYERINRIAQKHPIKIEELVKATEFRQSLYLKVLSYLIQLDCSEKIVAIQFLSRIGAGINAEKYTSQYLMQLGAQVTTKDLESAIKELDFIKDYLLVDALMLMNMGKGFTVAGAAIIADWFKVWNYSKEDREAIAIIAKAFLTQEFDLLNTISVVEENRWQGKFWHYIPEEWIKGNRENYDDIGFTSIDQMHKGLVKKNNLILKGYNRIFGKSEEILARKDGIGYIKKRDSAMWTIYYICVTSYFDREELVFEGK